MSDHILRYILLPKGLKSILFKSYAYFLPFLYLLTIAFEYLSYIFYFLFIFFLFEIIINPSRYQFNDLKDFEGDKKRGHNWYRPFVNDDRNLVFFAAVLRFLLGTSIAFLLDYRLAVLAFIFIVSQFFYDYFAKEYHPLLSVIIISIMYPLRSLTVIYGLNVDFDLNVYILLILIFLFAEYMVLQWRKNESFFIYEKKLVPKSNSSFFITKKLELLISFNLLLFLMSLVTFIISFFRFNLDNSIILYSFSIFLFLFLLIIKREKLYSLISQFHSLLFFIIFAILTLNKFIISLSIVTVTTLVLIWYHRIYVSRFSDNYFIKQ